MGKAEKAAPLKGNIETLHELACLPIADVNFSRSVAYRQPMAIGRQIHLMLAAAQRLMDPLPPTWPVGGIIQ